MQLHRKHLYLLCFDCMPCRTNNCSWMVFPRFVVSHMLTYVVFPHKQPSIILVSIVQMPYKCSYLVSCLLLKYTYMFLHAYQCLLFVFICCANTIISKTFAYNLHTVYMQVNMSAYFESPLAMLQLIHYHLHRSSDTYWFILVNLLQNFKRNFLDLWKSALIWYLHQSLQLLFCGFIIAGDVC